MAALMNVQVVLVRAQNPANIGQVARAIQNFSASGLILVRCAPHTVTQAYDTACQAEKILDSAQVCDSLDAALKDSALSVGFTTRTGRHRGGLRPFSKEIPRILEIVRARNVHLVFGNERNGLSNEELSRCHVQATIPADASYPSLNLAHAVAMALGNLFSGGEESARLFKKHERFYPTPEEFSSLMNDFLETLRLLDYEKNPGGVVMNQVYAQLESFFRRSALERREVNLLKALLAQIRKKLMTKVC